MGEDDLKVTHFLYNYFVFETMSHNVAQDDLGKKKSGPGWPRAQRDLCASSAVLPARLPYQAQCHS